MRHKLSLCFVLLLSLCRLANAQSTPDLVLYDNFNQKFLNPHKWATSSPCFTWTVLDCVREIQDGQLRLAVRGYGATNSNQGIQYGESELHFLNPNHIRSISTDLVVRRVDAMGCPANTGFNSGGHAILQGNFFNSGSGNVNDDVQALLFFNHLAGDPQGVLTPVGLLHWQGQFFGGVGLANVNVGQRITAQLTWDRLHRQFVARWIDLSSGIVSQAAMPYTMPDNTLPAAPDKLLGVRIFPPNCIGTEMLVTGMEATFDNVMISRTEE